ncbi:TSUP family transporter [Corynebacterium sp. SCR221107]|uniref:TSUP family transporter n=1 Tax=Corynebacterium sp. SCR221107 TaxID=3017361 RepID=UPI0022EC3C31|nr:TSUP family transporter [Corynebacterium sp. SCR221107]WBT08900.1 TSUP family transporter [Corynebacterium sp. SCR221107]
MDPLSVGILVAGAAVAGWIDAVIGGGGLVLIPLIMAVFPQLAPAVALATNKVAAVSGTASATATMLRKVGADKKKVVSYVPIALVCSGVGAFLASHIDKEVMRPVVIVLLLVAGTFVALRPQFGQDVAKDRTLTTARKLGAVGLVACVAFYDGIFGPGTGMFLIMGFTAILAQDFMTSAVLAKVVNTSTNVGALIVFIAAGHVLWKLALMLAVANIIGAQLGARTVIAGGTKLLRAALLTLVVVMSCYLTFQQFSA